MSPMFGRQKIGARSGGRPPAAIELSAEGVLAAAFDPAVEGGALFAYAPLPLGALVPGIAEANIRSANAVAGAIRSALGGLNLQSRAITLVLPDSAVRVFMLDFDSLPARLVVRLGKRAKVGIIGGYGEGN